MGLQRGRLLRQDAYRVLGFGDFRRRAARLVERLLVSMLGACHLLALQPEHRFGTLVEVGSRSELLAHFCAFLPQTRSSGHAFLTLRVFGFSLLTKFGKL